MDPRVDFALRAQPPEDDQVQMFMPIANGGVSGEVQAFMPIAEGGVTGGGTQW